MCVFCVRAMLRIGILDFHKLKISDFATPEEALDVAKDYVKVQREALPNIEDKHPTINMPNEKASLYWYIQIEGSVTKWAQIHEQQYLMETKLNDKDLAAIGQFGSKDSEMGMLVPHQVNMTQVKKELGSLCDLEKLKKETESAYLMYRNAFQLFWESCLCFI